MQFVWHKHYDAHVPTQLEYPRQTIPDLFLESCQKHADRPALDFMGKQMHYAELMDQAMRMAGWLHKAGIQTGDRIFLLLPNTPHFAVAHFAAMLLGAVVVPASPLDTAPEVAHKVRDSGARAVIFLDLLFGNIKGLLADEKILVFLGADIKDHLPGLKRLLFPIKKRFLKRELPHYDGQRLFSCARVLKQAQRLQRTARMHRTADDLAVLLYTGGTTGVSQGVMLSHHAMLNNVRQGRHWVDLKADDVILCVLPFFHGFGMSMGLHMGILNGARLVLMLRFDAGQTIQHFIKDGITVFAGVPTMYIALIGHPQFQKLRGTKLRGCFVGAAPVPESLKKEFKTRTGGTLIEGYGLTEAVTAICAAPYKGQKKEKSIGIPWPDTEFRLVHAETGEPLEEPDAEGELILRSPTLMQGYWNNPEKTAQTIRDGWLYTGDIARMDRDGFFYIVDRKKDLIISGGFNVYPSEIEEVLFAHPAIRLACVIGVADDFKGEVPRAYVVLHPEKKISVEDLRAHTSDRLIKYKVPRDFIFREDLPTSPIGKVLKKELRRELEDT